MIDRLTVARSHLVDQSRAVAYHLVSRCVRRGFLGGDHWDYRRERIYDAVRKQAAGFAIDILAGARFTSSMGPRGSDPGS